MKRRLLTAVACLAALSMPAAKAAGVPIVDTPAALHSANVHLLANFPTGEGVGGTFAKIGDKLYYFQTTGKLGAIPGGGYGYQTGTDGGVWAFDATNPEAPTLAGHFPIPFWENEDVNVSASRKLLFFTADNRPTQSTVCGNVPASTEGAAGVPGPDESTTVKPVTCRRNPAILFIVDVSNPSVMTLKSYLILPQDLGNRASGTPKRAAGHTATCYDADCNYVIISAPADHGATVVDATDAAHPKLLGEMAGSPAGADNWYYSPGTTHDADVDRYGNLWLVGSGGSAMYQKTKDPLHPKLLATTPASLGVSKSYDNLDATKTTNQLIHHASQRLDKNTVMINEEWFTGSGDCGGPKGSHGEQDGRIQTWSIDLKHKRLNLLNMWDTELAGLIQGAEVEAGVGIGCSSHWFDINSGKLAAEGWYEQGLRFFDVSNPKKIRQVGYYMAENTAASQAQFVPGTDDIVYVADYQRGFDVFKIDGGKTPAAHKTVIAPVRAQWLKGYAGVDFGPRFSPDPDWGWACAHVSG